MSSGHEGLNSMQFASSICSMLTAEVVVAAGQIREKRVEVAGLLHTETETTQGGVSTIMSSA